MQDKEQKAELQEVFHGAKNSGNVDHVAGWYVKAAEHMGDLPARAASRLVGYASGVARHQF